ncbi:MAG TPA: TonB-dependent receptor [Opitutaceae bacterium]|jgi:TonB-dependent receptor|nr:TonB-dependent receptor [Opitutaceae bacterium]
MTNNAYPGSLRVSQVRAGFSPALVSVTALALILAASSASAQQAPATPAAADPNAPTVTMEAVTVSGVRASLISAQEIKENTPELVDSIVAEDIGKFPDVTTADALARVPGVQVSHTNGEAENVVVRGLPNIETTINGYEVFTGTGRGVALEDIPAEMLAGIDTYKSVGADQIEGGVAGLIDVRLHRPFDFAGPEFALTTRGYYSDQAKKDSYNLSALVSDRWKVQGGEFGILVDVSYSRQQYEDQIADNYVHFGANGEQFDLATDPSGTRGYYADNYGLQLIPGTRTRPAASIMLQWKNNDGLELHWDNLFTGYRNTHQVNFFIAIPSFGGFTDNVVLFPAGSEGYNVPETFDGLGTPARFVQSLVAHNTNTIASKQAFSDSTDTYQGAVGGSWVHNNITLSDEVSYNFTTVKTRGVILDTIIITPTMDVKYNLNAPTTINLSGTDYTDASNYHLSQYFDQWDRDHSIQYAVRSDVVVRLQNALLNSLKFGVRYSDRDVDSHSANPGSYGLPFATLASSIPGLMELSQSTPFVSAQQLNVRQWLSASESFLLGQTDVIRALAGRPLGLPQDDPSRTFLDVEKNFATYALANYHASLGDLPVDGEFGLRFTDAHDTLGGYQQQSVGGSTTGPFVLTTVDSARWDALPTANGRLKLTDNLLLRASFTKTVTRPDYAELNPAVSLTSPGPTIQGSGSGGNPDLDPIRSTNYDLALEYYPTKSSQMTVAGFYRTIDGYIQNYADEEVIGGNSYSITRPRSTHDGSLQGMEAGFQQFFDFLPDAFKGFGVQANYTYIDGQTQSPLTLQKTPLAQVSKNNYNVVLIYEKGPVSARLAYNWRDKFIDSFNQPGIQPTTVWVQPNDRLDFSLDYKLTKNLALTFDATNILDHKYHDNFGDLPMFTRDTRNYDRTYGVGLRYQY